LIAAKLLHIVIPAKAGNQEPPVTKCGLVVQTADYWIPAFAGRTEPTVRGTFVN
jgi:hypothetical protein